MNPKLLQGVAISLLMIALLWLILALQPEQEMIDDDNPLLKDDVTRIVAHAGGNMEFPDNTLEAFYNAYSVDPDVVMEADVAITADEEIVLTHDVTFDRKTTLVEAPVEKITYEYLMEEEIDFGYDNPIENNAFNTDEVFERYTNYAGEEVTPMDVDYPEGVSPRHEEKFLATTFEELITAFPDNAFIIEIKNSGELGEKALERVMEIMHDLDDDYDTFDRVSLGSFHRDVYDQFVALKDNNPDLMFSPQNYGVARFYIMQLLGVNGLYNEPVTSFQVPTSDGPINLATQRFIDNANKHNIAVTYWTINDEATMRELIEIGADGILTDRPTKLYEILQEYK